MHTSQGALAWNQRVNRGAVNRERGEILSSFVWTVLACPACACLSRLGGWQRNSRCLPSSHCHPLSSFFKSFFLLVHLSFIPSFLFFFFYTFFLSLNDSLDSIKVFLGYILGTVNSSSLKAGAKFCPWLTHFVCGRQRAEPTISYYPTLS